MKLETFFEKFDQFADAPDAVARLRDVVYSVELAAEKWPHESLESVALKVTDGTHQTPRYVETGIPFVSVKDFSGGSLDMSATRFITSEEHGEIYKRCDPKRGDILLGRIGTIGKAVVVDTDIEFSLFVSAAQIRPDRGKILSRYLQYVLNSPFCRAQFDNIKVGGATHTNKLNLKDLRSVRIPLPPLAEQKRIVAKVDELMALCDRLEAQQQERQTRHAALARASLSRFADAPTPANLHFLFHPSYAISPADLRKSILDLAVFGNLAAPAPDDDEIPSIEEFREAAASLSKALGLRSPKELLEDAEPPFDVPSHWRWMALADLGAAQTGTTPSKNDHEAFNGDIPFIKPADILPDGINYSNESLTRYGAESGSRLAPAGSLLMVCIGTIGKCNLIERECAFNQQINSLSPVQWVDSQYLLLAVRAPYFQDAAWKKSSSTTIAILNKGKWLSIPVPIPPLAEQRRIVAKVEQLMALVDALETQLAASRATAEKLLAAVVAELTEGTHASPAC